ncbi:LAFA_0F11870g1_1 [Lachancea sp. 'fantastica']|nr:LAFA_0F11870g1_1 [Lachancea sp. 'fantastica']
MGDEAVESFNYVAQKLSEDQLFHDFSPLIEHLVIADWLATLIVICLIIN